MALHGVTSASIRAPSGIINKALPMSRGCILAASFVDRGVGIGGTMWDSSGFGRHGAINGVDATNPLAVSTGAGGRGIDSTLSAARTISFGDDAFVPTNGNFSVLLFIEVFPGGTVGISFGNDESVLSSTDQWHVLLPFTNGHVYFDYGGEAKGTTRVTTEGGATPGISGLSAFVCTSGPRGMDIWLNGAKIASHTVHPTRTSTTAATFSIGEGGAFDKWQYARLYSAQLWSRQLSENECRLATRDPFALWRSAPRVLALPPVTGGGTTVVATTAALALTPIAASVASDTGITATTGTLGMIPVAASVNAAVGITTTTQALAFAAQAAQVVLSGSIIAATAPLTLAPQNAAVALDVQLTVTTAQLALAPQAATVAFGATITATTAALAFAQQAVTVLYPVSITAGTANLGLTPIRAQTGSSTGAVVVIYGFDLVEATLDTSPATIPVVYSTNTIPVQVTTLP